MKYIKLNKPGAITILILLVLTVVFACKKIDNEINRQNAESGIVAFAPGNALLGDTIVVFVKAGMPGASASLKIGQADVKVLSKVNDTYNKRQVERWTIVVPKNAPFGQPPVELTVNGERKPAFYGLVLEEPPILLEGKVMASILAGKTGPRELNECGYEIIHPATDGPALNAQMRETNLVACSRDGGIVYVVDTYAYYTCGGELDIAQSKTLIRKIQNGMVTTIAGGGGDPHGNGLAAKLPDNIRGIAMGPDGLLYLAISPSNYQSVPAEGRIMTFDPLSGAIKLVAGHEEYRGYGDVIKDGAAVNALIGDPGDMAFDKDGSLYFLDKRYFIRKLDPKGQVTTLFGPIAKTIVNGEELISNANSRRGHEDGFSNDEAQFGDLTGIASAGNGKLYVVDNGGEKFGGCVREINPQTMEVATIIGLPLGMAGKQTGSFKEVSGGNSSYYDYFIGMDADFDGNLLLTRNVEAGGEIKLFKVDLQQETVKLIAGGGDEQDDPKPVPGNKTKLFGGNIAFDDRGNLYIGDFFKYVVRKIEREK